MNQLILWKIMKQRVLFGTLFTYQVLSLHIIEHMSEECYRSYWYHKENKSVKFLKFHELYQPRLSTTQRNTETFNTSLLSTVW